MDFDWTERYVAWAIIAVVFFAASGMIKNEPNTTAAIVYGSAAFSITLMLFIGEHQYQNNFGRNKRGINIFAFLFGALAGSAPILASANILDVDTALLVAFIGIGLFLFLQYQNFLESLKKESDNARYFAVAPMVVWLIWGIMYFRNLPAAVVWYSLVYRAGLMLFAGWAAIRTFYNGDDQSKPMKISLMLIAVIAIGILLTAYLQPIGLHWVA